MRVTLMAPTYNSLHGRPFYAGRFARHGKILKEFALDVR
jgi:hypothetical protein